MNMGPLFFMKAIHKKLRSTRILFLFTTDRCNLKCIYCSTKSNQRRPGRILTLGEQKSLISESRRMGLRYVMFCGAGEPTMDRNLPSLIRHARNIGMTPMLVTNGTLITEEIAEMLHKNLVHVCFKLESFDDERTDMICGRKDPYTWKRHRYITKGGTSEKMIPSGLKHLLDEYSSRIARRMIKIDTVLNRINRDEAADIARFCRANHIGLNLRELRIAGRAKENLSSINLTREEIDNIHRELGRIMGRRFFRKLRRERCDMRYNPCISEDGECIVCESVGASSGNIRKDSLSVLFSKSMKLKRTIPCNVQYYKRRID